MVYVHNFKLRLLFKITLASKLLSDSLFAFGVFVMLAKENNLSTGAEDGSMTLTLLFKKTFLMAGYAWIEFEEKSASMTILVLHFRK